MYGFEKIPAPVLAKALEIWNSSPLDPEWANYGPQCGFGEWRSYGGKRMCPWGAILVALGISPYRPFSCTIQVERWGSTYPETYTIENPAFPQSARGVKSLLRSVCLDSLVSQFGNEEIDDFMDDWDFGRVRKLAEIWEAGNA